MKPYTVQEIRLSFVRSRRRTFYGSSSVEIAYAFKNLTKEVRESLYAVYLSGSNEIIGFERVCTGTIASAPAEPAEVLRTALIVGARAIIIIHNHPSGSIAPSEEDHRLTMSIAQTAKLFKIQLLDHLIIGANGAYYSFADRGIIVGDEVAPFKLAGKNGRPKLKARVLTRTH